MTRSDEELTTEERRAFEALSREKTPPAGLRERTKASLRRAGRLAGAGEGSWSPWNRARAAAVLLVTFGLGYAAAEIGEARPRPHVVPTIAGGSPDPEAIQGMGTSYAEALAELRRTYRSTDPSSQAARTAAIATFLATLEQMNGLTGVNAVPRETTATLRALLGAPEAVDMGWF